MKKQLLKSEVAPNLKVGDIIEFTNACNYKVKMFVSRVEEKSWYSNGRNSYGTLKHYMAHPDFKIISNN